MHAPSRNSISAADTVVMATMTCKTKRENNSGCSAVATPKRPPTSTSKPRPSLITSAVLVSLLATFVVLPPASRSSTPSSSPRAVAADADVDVGTSSGVVGGVNDDDDDDDDEMVAVKRQRRDDVAAAGGGSTSSSSSSSSSSAPAAPRIVEDPVDDNRQVYTPPNGEETK